MTEGVDTVVMKFGGSSVADPEKVRNVARRLVEARRTGLRVVGTVSAMGKTTDTLIALAGEVSPTPNPRELDMILSTGERIACALVAMAIHDLGEDAVSYTGSQAGILDASHTRAKIREIRGDRIRTALDQGRIVLVAGFQGFSRETMEITTLGRGGTDATAVALAAALGGACEIYSDVLGVFTADPRLVPEARKLPFVSYDEMLGMAASGAKVPSCSARWSWHATTACGSTHARRSPTRREPGCRTQREWSSRSSRRSAHSETDVVFTLTGIPDRPGVAARIFEGVASAQVNVDTIIQNVVHGRAEMSFSVPAEDVANTRSAITALQEELGAFDVDANTELGKVSLIGAGMRSHPGVAATMFRTLAELGINLEMISTSPIKISCMIARDRIPEAVRGLHTAFALEREPEREPTI